MNPKFTVQPYDPLDEALENFRQLNENPESVEHSEDDLVRLAVHAVNNHDVKN